MSVVYRTRVLLVRMGKFLPFVLCGIVLISYAETACRLLADDLVMWNEYTITNNTISWYIGRYFEYDLVTLIALLVMSVAVETCYWNKLALLYLLIQLGEKDYFSSIELYPEYIYLICIINIAICGLFCYKGVRIIISK